MMKGVIIGILFVNCIGIFGKPRPRLMKRIVKRHTNRGFNIEKYQEDQLNLHNYYRSLHGVPPLVLDPTLSEEAQDYAYSMLRNNEFQYCDSTKCNPSAAAESISKMTNATEHWYQQVNDLDYCSFNQGRASTRPGSEGKIIFDFTQLVWASTKKIGIGFAHSADGKKKYVVARYFPPGNFFGQFSQNVPKAVHMKEKYQLNCDGVNGGFTEWSQPGACSKTCGKGISYQTRSCSNPKPSLNGRACVGESERLHPFWCNSQSCPVPVDERSLQCEKRGFAPVSYNFGGKHECILMCQEPKSSNLFSPRGTVDDGSLCNNENGTCIKGQCTLLGSEPMTSFPYIKTPFSKPPSNNTQASTKQMNTTVIATTQEATTTEAETTTQKPTTTVPPTTMSTTINAIVLNGGYSEWSQPGPCSKVCGTGISYRMRTCLVPQASGGCVGPSREIYKYWCNPQPCKPSIVDRNYQCKNRGYNEVGHDFGGADECNLHCRDSETGYFFHRGSVDPGTQCNHGNGACVDNICVPMTYKPGTVIVGKYHEIPSSTYWKNIIVAIPNGSKNVKIMRKNREVDAVVGYRSNKAYGYEASSVVKGVKVIYHFNSDITIHGPVYPTEGYQIVIYALGESRANIEFEYTPPSI
ncbi:SCO-spondin-like [Xenia sp. Carnegie-2017]|uniref:SCO-spondin-like n=1 Tax=Xenia sp. Carnegie-2017 TaxID=2897299 RepID=UPI001F04B3E7|nr:SCO-spondin-like [Xenia sp. Carnegie-2017]